MTANKWIIPRETREWVGPITPTVTDRDTGLPVVIDPAALRFAVLTLDTRPTGPDWTVPVPDPEGGPLVGVQTVPVASYKRLGVWAQVTAGLDVIVLEPSQVGYITRT